MCGSTPSPARWSASTSDKEGSTTPPSRAPVGRGGRAIQMLLNCSWQGPANDVDCQLWNQHRRHDDEATERTTNHSLCRLRR